MASNPSAVKKAAQKYGHLVDRIAKRYDKNLTGAELLMKLSKGESNFDMGAVSSAGARGATQFMPSSRQEAIRRFGVDPWKNEDQAIHAAALHLLGKINGTAGLEGYNPGSDTYPSYILNQKVGRVRDAGGGSSSTPTTTTPGTYDSGTPPRFIPGKTTQDVSGALTDALMMGRSGRKGQSLMQAAMGLLQTGEYDRTTPAQIVPGRDPSFTPGEQPDSKSPAKKDLGNKSGALKPSGGWGGSKGPATELAKIGLNLGLQSMSEKRHNTNPYSGSHSDHELSKKNAYAYDLSNGSAPTPEMDEAAYQIMHRLGFKNYKRGQPINTSQGVKTINGIRYQVIYRGSGEAFGGNHLNHVHVGVERVG